MPNYADLDNKNTTKRLSAYAGVIDIRLTDKESEIMRVLWNGSNNHMTTSGSIAATPKRTRKENLINFI
jgi:hypothetical protein